MATGIAPLPFGGRVRPLECQLYRRSVNSRRAYGRLALQTQDLDARKVDFRANWRDSGGSIEGANSCTARTSCMGYSSDQLFNVSLIFSATRTSSTLRFARERVSSGRSGSFIHWYEQSGDSR